VITGLTVEVLRHLCRQELPSSNVPSDEIYGPKLAVPLPDPDPLEVGHPLCTHPHRSLVVARGRVVRPGCRDQKARVTDYEDLVIQDVHVLSSRVTHFGERPVDVALVELMVTTDIDHRAFEGVVRPRHSPATHRDVAGQDNQIGICRWRLVKMPYRVTRCPLSSSS